MKGRARTRLAVASAGGGDGGGGGGGVGVGGGEERAGAGAKRSAREEGQGERVKDGAAAVVVVEGGWICAICTFANLVRLFLFFFNLDFAFYGSARFVLLPTR